MPQQNAADTCAKMHRTADGERINVEWSLLEPGGVVGDEGESTETDLSTACSICRLAPWRLHPSAIAVILRRKS